MSESFTNLDPFGRKSSKSSESILTNEGISIFYPRKIETRVNKGNVIEKQIFAVKETTAKGSFESIHFEFEKPFFDIG